MGGASAGMVHLPGGMAAGSVHLPASMAGSLRPGGAGVHLPGGLPAPGSGLGIAARPAEPVASRGGLNAERVGVGRPLATGARPMLGQRHAEPERFAAQPAARGLAPRLTPRLAPGEARPGALPAGGPGERRAPAIASGHVVGAAFHPAAVVPRNPLHDPRLGVMPERAIRGLAQGYAVPRPPRPYLQLDGRRDLAVDRAFVDRHAGDFHARLVREMDPHERALWRAGLWRNEWHYGRRGWWWEADGAWYPYADPIWPYPAAVAALAVYATPTIEGADLAPIERAGGDGAPADAGGLGAADGSGPNAAVSGAIRGGGSDLVQTAAAGVPPLPAAPSGWYRCPTPDGFYPTQASCGGGWELVQTPPLPGE